MEKLIEDIIQFNNIAGSLFFVEVCRVFKKLYLEEKNNLLVAFFLAIVYCIVSIPVRREIPANGDYLRRQSIFF